MSAVQNVNTPRLYEEWDEEETSRRIDAANLFGYDLMRYCRNEALKKASQKLPQDSDTLPIVEEAIDTALHNVCDLLEGFFTIANVGEKYEAAYVLAVAVHDEKWEIIEKVDISPNMIDLQIGYWKWRDGDFR
jgi:hypothetical protein